MSSNLCQQSQAHRLYSLYLHYDASHNAKHEDPECKAVLQHCFALFEKDYVVGTVSNHNGQLCSSYPSELAILERPRDPSSAGTLQPRGQDDQHDKDGGKMNSLFPPSAIGHVLSSSTSSHSAPPQHLSTFRSTSSELSQDTLSQDLSLGSSTASTTTTSSSPSIHPLTLSHASNTTHNSTGSNMGSQRSLAADRSTSSNGANFDSANDFSNSAMHGLTNQQNLDQSFIDDVADQSFDLAESGMMSFQDIKSDLDMIQPPHFLQRVRGEQGGQQRQSPFSQSDDHDRSIRHILPFPFRIPTRPEKKVNVAIKEYEDPSQSSHNSKREQDSEASMENKDKVNDTHELSKQFEKSHFARVRARFVIPCILVRGKNICRSATLSNEVEVFMHSFNQKINDLNQKRKMFLYGTGERSPDKEDRESSLEKQRLEDIELLHQLGVTYINDLMVENRKVKYGLKVTSSEKVDSFGRYSKFKLVATPYPGVEFFQKFKANKYSARKLRFDWSQNFADAELQLPPGHDDNLGIRWRDYKSWDLIELTQNYLRLYLTHIADDTNDQIQGHNLAGAINSAAGTSQRPSKGLLIHCISGWDRTPLFISLLRISLWADGEAHQSLTAAEMLYLTMGYDWFLFNHLLADRSQRGEDIFYFCFYFLKFIYGEEFSLKSISNLSKQKKTRDRPNSRRPSSQSPMLKNIGRLRGSVTGIGGELSGSAGSDADNALHHGFVCDECRSLRKSPNEPIGVDMVTSTKSNNQDAASSTDGKASSWQMVSFSTPPGRHGSSPLAPFVPTLQAMSRMSASGSPLGAGGKRTTYSTGFSDDNSGRNSALDQEVLDVEQPSATSPFMLEDGRFRLGTQQFNARRSSSSGIPNLFADEPRRMSHGSVISGISGLEISRVATSPNLASSRSNDELDEPTDGTRDELSGERHAAPRKRASTFDGGLLLSVSHEADADRIDTKDQEEEDEEEEDLTSGDDDDGDEGSGHCNTQSTTNALLSSSTKTLGPRICQSCHHSFLVTTSTGNRADLVTRGSPYTSTGCPIPVDSDASNSSRLKLQQYHQPKNQPLERTRIVDPLFSQDDIESVCHGQNMKELDREEGMFQLEIDDRPSYPIAKSNREKSELDCLVGAPCLPGLGGSSCSDRDQHARGLSSVADEAESIEGDENESFWDETSTVDFGCSPGSILNGFGLGLTKCDPDHVDGLDIVSDSLGRPTDDAVRCEDDDDDEDEDDDDDCAASLNSHQSSIKMDHHENNRLFMPSLKGVFAAPSRPSQGHGRSQDDSSLENSFPSEAHAPFTRNLTDNYHRNSLTDTAKDDFHNSLGQGAGEGKRANEGPSQKTLSRRQKLRQLRRLFMDIRSEIGDGTRSPSRSLLPDNKGANVPPMSAEEDDEEDDSASSFRAESFSDDPSFRYQSPIATAASFASRHGGSISTAPSTLTSTPANMRHEFDLEQRFFARGSTSSTTRHTESFIVSPTAHSQHQHKQQQRQGLTAPSSNGRKSPFEWAAAAASSAAASISSGIVSGGFGSSSTSSVSARQSPLMKPSSHHTQQQQQHQQLQQKPTNSPSGSSHYSRQFALPSPHVQFLPQQQHSHVGSSMQSPNSGTTTPLGQFQDQAMSLSFQQRMSGERLNREGNGPDSMRRRSLASSNGHIGSLSAPSSSPALTSTTRMRGAGVESVSTSVVGGDSGHLKEKGSENSGRWDWVF